MDWFLDRLSSINWVNWGIVPLIAAAVGYLARRKIEGSKDAETMDGLNKAADLQVKLKSNGISLDELRSFRTDVLSKPARAALVVAQHYADVATTLTSEALRADGDDDLNAATTQLELNQISASCFHAVDQMLVATAIDLATRLPPKRARALEKSQAAWLAFRNAEAERVTSEWEGGSIAPLMVASKLEALTRERQAALELDFKGADGRILEARREATPNNLLDLIEPGVPKVRVEELLGVPHYVSAEPSLDFDHCFYRYVNTQVEISYKADVVADVIVLLCHGYTYQAKVGSLGTLTLGRLTLADVLAIDSQLKVEFDASARTKQLSVPIRVGPPGAWEMYWVGATSIHSGAGQLQATEFDWDSTLGQLITPASDVIINWIAKPRLSKEPPMFFWFIR